MMPLLALEAPLEGRGIPSRVRVWVGVAPEIQTSSSPNKSLDVAGSDSCEGNVWPSCLRRLFVLGRGSFSEFLASILDVRCFFPMRAVALAADLLRFSSSSLRRSPC